MRPKQQKKKTADFVFFSFIHIFVNKRRLIRNCVLRNLHNISRLGYFSRLLEGNDRRLHWEVCSGTFSVFIFIFSEMGVLDAFFAGGFFGAFLLYFENIHDLCVIQFHFQFGVVYGLPNTLHLFYTLLHRRRYTLAFSSFDIFSDRKVDRQNNKICWYKMLFL